MEKKKIISSALIVVFLCFIISSIMLVNKKPDYSKIPKAQQIAEYVKPAVVRIYSGVVVKWNYRPISYDYYDSSIAYEFDTNVIQFLKSNQYYTSLAYQGSGAVISPNGYIVTNAHVVELMKIDDSQLQALILVDMCIKLAEFFNDNHVYQYNVTPEGIYSLIKNNLVIDNVDKLTKVCLPGGEDPVDGEIKSYGAPTGEGKDVAVIKIEKNNLSSVILGDSEKTQLQDNVWVFGYPAAADSELLSKESELVVTITDGKVSATDKKSAQGAPVLQINAAATHGNSGGPVIDEDGNVIGLLTFRSENNPNETQGFNFVVPVNTVKEFVSQAGAKNEEGDVNKLYKDGLQLYWAGYYKDALGKFEAVQRLNANQSEIKKFISDCQQKSSQSKTLWSKYKNIAIGLDSLAAILIIVLIYFGFLKNRARKGSLAHDLLNGKSVENTGSEGVESYPKKNQSDSTEDSSYKVETNKDSIFNKKDNLSEEENYTVIIKGKLYAMSGPLEGKEIELYNEPLIIGRDHRNCNLVFPQDCVKVARKHCYISYNSEKQIFILEDCLSTHGTFLKAGERINPMEKYYLKSGDSFYLGSEENLFEVWIE